MLLKIQFLVYSEHSKYFEVKSVNVIVQYEDNYFVQRIVRDP